MERRNGATLSADDADAALRRRNQRGTTLIELLASMLLVSILAAISYTFARAVFVNAQLQEARSDAQEATVMALDVMMRELRLAGFSAAGQAMTGIRVAAPQRVEVASDTNGDGDSDDANEVVGYSYDATKQALMRATGGGSPQPFVRNVPSDGLQFAFTDADGHELPTPVGGLALSARRQIRRIDMQLRVELKAAVPFNIAPVTSTLSGSVSLRNF